MAPLAGSASRLCWQPFHDSCLFATRCSGQSLGKSKSVRISTRRQEPQRGRVLLLSLLNPKAKATLCYAALSFLDPGRYWAPRGSLDEEFWIGPGHVAPHPTPLAMTASKPSPGGIAVQGSPVPGTETSGKRTTAKILEGSSSLQNSCPFS